MDEHRAGPRRSEQARIAVLTAAADLLAEVGYEHLTIEAVARRAGVGKQTIYRWWTSRAAVVAESLFEGYVLREQLSVRDTGDLRADLGDWLDRIDRLLEDERGLHLVRAVVAVSIEQPDVGMLLREKLAADGAVRARLIASGHPDLPVDEISDALVGALIVRALGPAPHRGRGHAVLDALLHGYA